MIKRLCKFVEEKRGSKRLFWKILVTEKDIAWFIVDNLRELFKERKDFFIKNNIREGTTVKIKGRKLKILHLHDVDNWAIHNVGRLWLEDIPFVETEFRNLKNVKSEEFHNYDLIWYGSSYLYLKKPFDIKRSIIAVHDPDEIFPPEINEKSRLVFLRERIKADEEKGRRLRILKKYETIITISKELKEMLEKEDIKTYLIQTTSTLPEIKNIKTNNCRICLVFREYPRKNPELMYYLKDYAEKKLGIEFDIKGGLGFDYLSEEDYIKYLDRHEIYICTSFQEGGPIPAMDAMKRGLVVLTTPVGQIQELIEDGKNGFICRTKEDFIKRIELLSKSKEILHKMRVESEKTILKLRNVEDIKNNVANFLKKFIDFN